MTATETQALTPSLIRICGRRSSPLPAHFKGLVGRAAQAAVRKTAQVSATLTRDSIFPGQVLRDTRWSSKPEYRAQYPDARPIYATRTPVPARTLTGLTAAVQLRLRVATGLQALQRCSGFLNRRARGSTVATHQFAEVDSEELIVDRRSRGRNCDSVSINSQDYQPSTTFCRRGSAATAAVS